MIRDLALRVYKVAGWTIIGFALTVMLFRTITPYLLPTGPQLSKWVADALHYPTRIDKIFVTWEGFNPAITLTEVQVFSPEMQPSFYARSMKLLVNVPYLLFRRIQIEEIVLEGATIAIDYQSPSRLSVLGLPEFQFDLQNFSAHSSLPRPKRLIVDNSRVDLKINQTQEAHLTSVRLGIEGNQLIKIRGEANILEIGGAKVKFAADLPQAKHAVATLFCDGQGVFLSQLMAFLPKQPITLQNGVLDFKAWIKIKDRKHISLTTELMAKDLLLANKEGSISHQLLKGTLKIQRANQSWKIIGNEWLLDEKDPIDFMLKMSPDPTGDEYELVARDLNLALLQEWLKRIDNLPEKVATLIENYPTAGRLSSLHMMGKKTEKAFIPTFANITFKDLQLQEKASTAKIYPLTGTLHYDNTGGQILIQGDTVSLNHPVYFENAVSLNNVKAALHWQANQSGFKIQVATLQGLTADTPFKGKGCLQLYQDKRPDIELLLELGSLKTAKALALFPRKVMDKDLIEWLDQAIIEGDVITTGIVVRGNLADFPFDNSKGIFEAYTHLKQVQLNYTPEWPALTDLTADLLFHNRDLTIISENGKLKEGTLLSAIAHIPDLAASPSELTVDATVADRLENGMKILQQSPLHATAKNLAPFSFKGPMSLDLHLQIPLAKDAQVKVKGGIKVADSTFTAPTWDLSVNHLLGEVFFTEQAVYTDKLQGKLFGSTSQFQIESFLNASEPSLRLTVLGRTDSEQLKQWLKWTNVDTVLGETDYTAQLTFATGNNPRLINITAFSSLLGVALNLPSPLTKLESTLRQLSVNVNFVSDHLLHVAGQYGDDLNAAVTLALKDAQWAALGAHVHLGGKRIANFREDNKLLVDGEINQLSFQQWKEFILPLKSALQGGMSLAPRIDLTIGTFDLFGLVFSKAKIQTKWENHIWQVHFDGPSLKGNLVLPEVEDGDINVNLQKLALAKSDEFSYLSSTNERWIHPINVKIQELIIDQKTFNDLQARLEPSWKGYLFRDVKAKMKGTEVQLSGNWDYLSSDKKVSAEGKIITNNISESLSSLGMEGTLHGAKGEARFSLQWNGSPAKIDYPSLGGYAEFSLSNGTVQGVNPGIGRILSLLNINQVARRLNFDFSDVTNKGFAFDNLHGRLQFGRGKVSSNKVTLTGPSANIEAFGQASLENQGLEGEMVVMPNVTGSLPLAAAIAAGNPAVGAAVWVADKMVGKKIQEINRFRYKVLGTWQEPFVKEVPMALSYRR